MKYLLVFTLCTAGLWLLIPARLPGIYRPAALAIRHRAPKPLAQSEVIIQRLAALLVIHIDMDPIKRAKLADTLSSLGHDETPEMWQARTIAKSLLLAVAATPLLLVSTFFGGIAIPLLGSEIYRQQWKVLEGEMDARRQRIERELPQFASTIRQSLNSTYDVVAILESYRKICGHALQDEITRTLNDIMTGNPERALKAFESRVSSAKLSQVIRGLIAVLRGDDQRIYFDMLAVEFRTAQNEEVEKELLQRPSKLNPYMGLLFACLFLLVAAALGAYLVQQMKSLY